MTAVVLFAKNEEKIIGPVIEDLKRALKQVPHSKPQLFLCDDSTDSTALVARDKGLVVIKGPGQGLGLSYYFALRFLSDKRFSSIITIDGDGQTDLQEIPYFYKELEKYDMVVGSRFLNKGLVSYPYPKINFFGVRVLSFLISVGAQQRFTDSHGGLRVMKTAVAKGMDFLGTHSYVQESIISSARRGFKIKELPSKWNQRVYGQSRVLHSKLQYIKAMALPLFLQVRVHWLLAFFLLMGLLFFRSLLLLAGLGLCAFLEVYKFQLFKHNRKKLDRWLKKGV